MGNIPIRRNELPGKILKEFIILLLVWVIVTSLLISLDGKYPFIVLFWVCLFPFGYFFYLVNLYWLIPAYEKKHKALITYIIGQVAAGIIIAFPFFIIGFSFPYGLSFLLLFFTLTAMISCGFSWLIYLRNKEQIQQMLYLRKELGKTTSRLQSLRAQINPHFLFNTLNTLYGLAIQENAARTGDGIQRLGDMMRFMLQDNRKDLIPLAGEIGYLKNYIYIQQLRLAASENMQLTVDIQEPEEEFRIAPMLLISFVENAFKHGVCLQEKSRISISLYGRDKVLYFGVRNSIHEKREEDTERNSTGIGLENVKERLNLLYPRKHHLSISENEDEYRVFLTLNL